MEQRLSARARRETKDIPLLRKAMKGNLFVCFQEPNSLNFFTSKAELDVRSYRLFQRAYIRWHE